MLTYIPVTPPWDAVHTFLVSGHTSVTGQALRILVRVAHTVQARKRNLGRKPKVPEAPRATRQLAAQRPRG